MYEMTAVVMTLLTLLTVMMMMMMPSSGVQTDCYRHA
jgi:hypothetical protein